MSAYHRIHLNFASFDAGPRSSPVETVRAVDGIDHFLLSICDQDDFTTYLEAEWRGIEPSAHAALAEPDETVFFIYAPPDTPSTASTGKGSDTSAFTDLTSGKDGSGSTSGLAMKTCDRTHRPRTSTTQGTTKSASLAKQIRQDVHDILQAFPTFTASGRQAIAYDIIAPDPRRRAVLERALGWDTFDPSSPSLGSRPMTMQMSKSKDGSGSEQPNSTARSRLPLPDGVALIFSAKEAIDPLHGQNTDMALDIEAGLEEKCWSVRRAALSKADWLEYKRQVEDAVTEDEEEANGVSAAYGSQAERASRGHTTASSSKAPNEWSEAEREKQRREAAIRKYGPPMAADGSYEWRNMYL